ncbi:MAG: FAD-dependent oxidoreductase [Clostridiales bacterium]|nr:FAD-dependent oxidoreductase [Clostridia bacterium]MCR4883093.1 FAD-dependent oxidoreductase [Clostridiales bacterium]
MQTRFDAIIIGAGPAGIFTAMELTALRPESTILIVDTGRAIANRTCPARKLGKCVHCDPCGIVHGWAGAGAFSDGKLSLSDEVGGHINEYMSHQKAQELIAHADEIYLRFGAPKEVHGLDDRKVDEIGYEASRYGIHLVPCPVRHLGTENSGLVLGGMHDYLTQQTKTIFMELTTANDLIVENGRIVGVNIHERGKEPCAVYAPYVVAAPGRGGAEWLASEASRLQLRTQNNEVDIGVRVEVPNSVMDHLTKHLYEAKLIYYSDTYENKVRTFCMNPGGVVSEEHYESGLAVVNGHSYEDQSLRTQNTNFAMLVSTHFTEPFNQPIEYGQYIARLANMLTGGPIMVQRLGDLLKGRRTTKERLAKSTTIPTLQTAVPGDLSFVLPERHLTSIVEALRAFDHIAPGLYNRNTLLYGVEVKFYSSKILVDSNFMTGVDGLYAIGDGAGITRGLMQASATGIAVARHIAAKLNS